MLSSVRPADTDRPRSVRGGNDLMECALMPVKSRLASTLTALLICAGIEVKREHVALSVVIDELLAISS